MLFFLTPTSDEHQQEPLLRHRINQVVDSQRLSSRTILDHGDSVYFIETARKDRLHHLEPTHEIQRWGCGEAGDGSLLVAVLLEAGDCNRTLNTFVDL